MIFHTSHLYFTRNAHFTDFRFCLGKQQFLWDQFLVVLEITAETQSLNHNLCTNNYTVYFIILNDYSVYSTIMSRQLANVIKKVSRIDSMGSSHATKVLI